MPIKLILRVTQKNIVVQNWLELTEYGRARMEYSFHWPFEPHDIELFHKILDTCVTLEPEQQHSDRVYQYGSRLWEGFFHDRDFYTLFINLQNRAKHGLQIHLLMDVPAYAAGPWEFINRQEHERHRRFLSIEEKVALVRSRQPEYRGIEPPEVRNGLRVLLVVISPPDGYEPVASAGIKQALTDAQIQFEVLEVYVSTIAQIQQMVAGNEFHIIHVLGHGQYNFETNSPQGEIMVYDEPGNYIPAAGEDLARALSPGTNSVRLVVLTNCASGRTFTVQEFSDVASQMADVFPAVLAMHSSISQNGAELFIAGLYERMATLIAEDKPVHLVEVMTAGRERLLTSPQTIIQVGIPILYLQTPGKDLLFKSHLTPASGATAPTEESRSRSAPQPPETGRTRRGQTNRSSNARKTDSRNAPQENLEANFPQTDSTRLSALIESLEAKEEFAELVDALKEILDGYLQLESYATYANYRAYQQRLIRHIEQLFEMQRWEDVCNMGRILNAPPLDALPLTATEKTALEERLTLANKKWHDQQTCIKLFGEAEQKYRARQWEQLLKLCTELEETYPQFRIEERDAMARVAVHTLEEYRYLQQEILSLAEQREWGIVYLLAYGLLLTDNQDALPNEEFHTILERAGDFIENRFQLPEALNAIHANGPDMDRWNALLAICSNILPESPRYEFARLLHEKLQQKTDIVVTSTIQVH